MEFDLITEEVGGRSVVAVSGELDVYTAPALEEAVAELLENGRVSLVVDLTAVEFMDSTGLGLLIKALKWTRERDGSLDVVVSSDKVRKVFTITGLDSVIQLHATRAQALAG